MYSAERLYRKLVEKYGTPLPYKKICGDEGIVLEKGDLGEVINGLYCRNNGVSLIVLSSRISYDERRDWGWHELWHHFNCFEASMHYATKEERHATYFAALCRIPRIQWNDTIAAVVDRYGVSPWIAKARIEFEAKKLNS